MDEPGGLTTEEKLLLLLALRERESSFANANRFFQSNKELLMRMVMVLKSSDTEATEEQQLIRSRLLPQLESQGW